MAENLDIQIKINNYVASHPKMCGKSDAVILSAMKEEGLVTQAEIDAAKTTSAFGFGFQNTMGMGLQVETMDSVKDYGKEPIEQAKKSEYYVPEPPLRKDGIRPEDIPYESQDDVISYMQQMVNSANKTMEDRDKRAGIISKAVNFWFEVKDREYAKSTVEAQIADTEMDLAILQNVRAGEYGDWTFTEAFKDRRGVEYNQENIDICLEKADEYELVKTLNMMVKTTIDQLYETTKGDVNSQMSPEDSTYAIQNALKLCGITTKEDVNKYLKDFEERYKNHYIMKKYGGNLRLSNNGSGKYARPCIYRTTPHPYHNNVEATNDQLKLIAIDLAKRLEKECAKAIGIEVPKGATLEDIADLNQEKLKQCKEAYEESFKTAFGEKDIAILAEKFAETQAKYEAYFEMGIDILSMAAMFVPGVNELAVGWALKAVRATGSMKGVKVLKTVHKFDKYMQKASLFWMANVTLKPAYIVERLTSKEGMTSEDWQEWGMSVLQNGVYMGLGMMASKVAEQFAALYKTQALVKAFRSKGYSVDYMQKIMRTTAFPKDIVKTMKSIDKMAKVLQISTESALDLSTTYLANKAMGNGDLQTMDWIMSIGTALMGGTIQKQFAPLSTEAKVQYLKNAFGEMKLSDFEAKQILKLMDDISAGRFDTRFRTYTAADAVIKPAAPETKLYDLSDAEIKEFYRQQIPGLTDTELDCLVAQMHRVKNGEPRWLGTEEEMDMLWDIYAKMDANNGRMRIREQRANDIPRTEIPVEAKNLSELDQNYLRSWYNNGNALAKDQRFAELFDRLGTELKEDVILYRCVSARADDGIDPRQIEFLNTIQEGSVIDNTGRYTSTASHPNTAIDYSRTFGQSYVLKINVPKGTKVLDMRACGQKIDEYILPKDTKYVVKSIDYRTGIVECDLVLEPAKVDVEPDNLTSARIDADVLPNGVKPEGVKVEIPHKPYTQMTDEEFELAKAEFAEELKTIEKVDKYYYQFVIEHLNKSNFEITRMMCTNENVPVQRIEFVMQIINKQNAEIAKIILSNEKYVDRIYEVLSNINETNIDFAKEICLAGELNIYVIESVLSYVNKTNIDFARDLCFKKDFPQNEIGSILRYTNQSNIEFARKLCADKDFNVYDIADILKYTNEYTIKFAELLCADKEFIKGHQIPYCLIFASKNNVDNKIEIYNYIKKFDHLQSEEKIEIIRATSCDNLEIAKLISGDKDFQAKLNEKEPDLELRKVIIGNVDSQNCDFAKLLFEEQNISGIKTRDIAELIYLTGPTCPRLTRKRDMKGITAAYEKIKTNSEIPYSWKKNIILEGVDNIEGLSKLINQYNNILKNPQKYINGEFTGEDAIKNVNDWFELNAAGFLSLANNLDKEALDNLFRRRMEDVVFEYLPKIKVFDELDFRILRECNDACNVDGKPLMPTQKVEMIDLIKCYKDMGLDVARLLPVDGKIDLGQAKIELFNEMMRKSGLTDAEIAAIPKEKLVSWDTTFAHFMAEEIAGNKTLQDLLRAANLDEFERYIHDVANEYGQANAKTQDLYRTNGMNYDAWLHPSKSSEITFKAMDKNQERLIQVSQQIIEDIEALRQTPAKGFIDKQFPQCIKDGKFFIPAEYLTSKEKLTELVKLLSDTSEQGQLAQMWKRAQNNSASEDPGKVARARNTLTILDHLNQRIDDISRLENAVSTKSFDVTIKMWDRVPQKDLFQGNYSTCCIGMGGVNGSAMPHFLLDTSYNMIELVDNNTGKVVGNALCYFVTGSDGKPKFIIDNIEINNGVKPSEEVGLALRQQITNYADRVAREVTGRDDIEIFMSDNYNDVPTSDLKPRQDRVSFLGETDCDDIYMDLYEGWVDHDKDASGNRTGSYTKDVKLLKLTPEKPATPPSGNNSTQRPANHELSAIETSLADGAKAEVEVDVKPQNVISIPAGKFEAPNAKFAETDEAFRSIVVKRSKDIKELNKITNIDEFCNKSFKLIKEEMGLEDSGINLKITDKDNYYDHETNTVYISRNWAGKENGHINGKGDKAEIFGGLAHELNHYLQWKEIVLNLDSENPNWNNLIAYLQKFEGAQKNIEYLIKKYPDNTELKAAFDKAKSYQNNWLNYVDAFDENGKLKTGAEYDKYKNQTVEAESFRRGDIVAEEYRKTVASTQPEVKETGEPKTSTSDMTESEPVKRNRFNLFRRIFRKNNSSSELADYFKPHQPEQTVKRVTFTNLSESDIALLNKYNIDLTGVDKPVKPRPVIPEPKKEKIEHPSNLTNELKRRHYRYRSELKELFDNNPDIRRVVGSVPRSWGKIFQDSNGIEKVDAAFSKFTNTVHHGGLEENAIQALEKELQSLINSEVKVKQLGGGGFGRTYKIEADGRNFVLKIFGQDMRNSGSTHGGWAELSSAVYASDKTKNVAKFYMGKFGETDTDTYILARYLSEEDADIGYHYSKPDGSSKGSGFKMVDEISKFGIADLRGDNYKGWKIVDYGQLYESQYGRMSHEGYKILRQMCEAADKKSYKRMQRIAEQYKNDPALKEAIDKYVEAIEWADTDLSILRDNVKLLECFEGYDWKPDFDYLVFYHNDALPKFYDISREEATQLYKIYFNINNKVDIGINGEDYM